MSASIVFCIEPAPPREEARFVGAHATATVQRWPGNGTEDVPPLWEVRVRGHHGDGDVDVHATPQAASRQAARAAGQPHVDTPWGVRPQATYN